MTRLPGISTSAAEAIRAVNAAWSRLPADLRPELSDWTELDRELDAACAEGELDRALDAIEAWREDNLDAIEEAERG